MFYLATITKWESRKDSKGRVGAIDRDSGRTFLINTDRMVDIISTGASSIKFKFIENPNNPRAGCDYIEANVSLADLIAGHDIPYSSNFMTLPIFEKNKPTRDTIDTTIEVSNFIYADENNADTSTCWVAYLKDGFRRVKALVNLSLSEIYTLTIGGLYDIDGNLYSTVQIGNKLWTTSNFMSTRYVDGTAIPNITAAVDWAADSTGAYCAYNNDIANIADYGLYYNGYAISNAHGLAPTGWRVPSDTDWADLITLLGGAAVVGGKLKETGIIHWRTPNTGATDEYGFKASPSNYRGFNGSFPAPLYPIQNVFLAWSSSVVLNQGRQVGLLYNSAGISNSTVNKGSGYVVRLIRDL